MSSGGPRTVSAGVTDGQENGFPATRGIAPVVRLQNEGALGAISDHEAVDDMVELAAITTALIDVTHKLSRLTAVWGILRGGQERMFQHFLLLDLRLGSLKAPLSDL